MPKNSEDVRQKLLNNTEEIYGMGRKLDDIERMYHNTVNIMSTANENLVEQRGTLQSIQDKNAKIATGLKMEQYAIREISMRELRQRGLLYTAAILLFLTDVALFIALL